jgi:transglutaminase-like putative cysteine protease
MFRKHFRLLITLTWVILLIVLFARNLFIPEISNREITLLQESKQERFYGIWFDNKRIGYVTEELVPNANGFTLNQVAYLLLNILETTQPINMRLRAQLNDGLVLEKFDFQFTSAFYKMEANGYVKDRTVHFQLDTGQSTIKDTVTLSGPPLLAVNDRSYLLEELNKTGQKIRVPSFDPVSLSGRESVITYYGQEKLLISKRMKALHKFSETTGNIRINFWLDDEGRIVKEESPAGFQFIAEPEFRAKDIVSPGNEILSAVAVRPTGLSPPVDSDSISYKLTFPPDLDLDVQGGRQKLQGNILKITQEQFPDSTTGPESSICTDPRYLMPSRYVQSDHESIIKLARSIVGTEADQARQVRFLSSWVYENIEKRPVLGLPDALTTLKNLKGDCNEHASLFTALARSLNISTAIVTGVTLQDGAFYYHAWNEVCLNGKWYSLDTTTDQLPADLFHIRFGKGDMEEQLKIGGLLGKLKIEFLPQK